MKSSILVFLCVVLGVLEAVTMVTAQCNLRNSLGAIVEKCSKIQECPSGWRYHGSGNTGGSCYLLVTERLNFDDARARCQSLDADIVSLSSKVEMSHVWEYAVDALGSFEQFWVGLRREGSGWRWLDGTAQDLPHEAFWNQNEPNNLWGNEDGTEMFSSGLVNDVSLGSENYVMCEKRLTL